MSSSGVTASRAGAQLLHRPERLGAVDLVRRLGAVQAQDLRAFPLALRARTEDPGSLDGLVRAPGSCAGRCTSCRPRTSRGCASCSPREGRPGRGGGSRSSASTRRRPTARWGRWHGRCEDGPLTRAEVAALLERARPALHGPGAGARPRRRGRAWRARPRDGGRDPAGARTRSRAGDPLAELARRHLASRAPAEPEDLAAWSGLPLGLARTAWKSLDVVELGDGWALRGHVPDPVPDDLVRLLPMFDELLLGWRDRTPVVPAAHAKAVLPGGGILRATVTVGGRVAGTWTRGGVELFAPVPERALEAELRRVRSPADPGGSS